MITRTHEAQGTFSEALYSPCQRYRYRLSRIWNSDAPKLLFVMLNPSKATELANDPTVERCERRARQLGYGAMCVANVFAWRATDPAQMKKARDPVGPENDATLRMATGWTDHILAAWGTHGAHLGRGPAVAHSLHQSGKPLFHLGLSKAGYPKHPLYLPYLQAPVRWTFQKAAEDAL
ncbi:MAG: DUF1643 domain-containing protein [Pseudomonadota bacterium]